MWGSQVAWTLATAFCLVTVPYLHPSESGYPSMEWTQPLQHNTEHRLQLVLLLFCEGPQKSPQPVIVAEWMSSHHRLEWPSWGPLAHPSKRINEAHLHTVASYNTERSWGGIVEDDNKPLSTTYPLMIAI